MMFLAKVIANVGTLLANVGSQACAFVIIDEPECPKSLIK